MCFTEMMRHFINYLSVRMDVGLLCFQNNSFSLDEICFSNSGLVSASSDYSEV